MSQFPATSQVSAESLEAANEEIRRLQFQVARLKGALQFMQQFLPEYARNGETALRLHKLINDKNLCEPNLPPALSSALS
jgi:hypothetical protein